MTNEFSGKSNQELDTELRKLDVADLHLRPLKQQLSRARNRWAVTGLVAGFIVTCIAIYIDSNPSELDVYFLLGLFGAVGGALIAGYVGPAFTNASAELHKRKNEIQAERLRIEELKRSLASAYWLHLVIGGIATQFLLTYAAESSLSTPQRFFLVISCFYYRFWACIQTWRAAGRYSGPAIWSALAKLAASIGFLVNLAFVFYLLLLFVQAST